jgi:hypothetical protein
MNIKFEQLYGLFVKFEIKLYYDKNEKLVEYPKMIRQCGHNKNIQRNFTWKENDLPIKISL